MTKTFKQLQEAEQLVSALIKAEPTLKDTKFGYAFKRFSEKNYVPLAKDFNNELTTLRIEYALEDKITGEVLTDRTNSRGFKYGKQPLKQLLIEETKLADKWDSMEFEITPYISKLPDTIELTEGQLEILTGLVL